MKSDFVKAVYSNVLKPLNEFYWFVIQTGLTPGSIKCLLMIDTIHIRCIVKLDIEHVHNLVKCSTVKREACT